VCSAGKNEIQRLEKDEGKEQRARIKYERNDACCISTGFLYSDSPSPGADVNKE
jgi:hypothetical protein